MPSKRPLARSFYARPPAVVAADCIGKHLIFESGGRLLSGRIVEAEAYLGIRDRAAHSFKGRRNKRNEVMYGPPGFAYVFFIYGMHYHLNLVTGAVDEPTAVLLRAVEPLMGKALMRQRRNTDVEHLLTNGPGKLCQAFGIGLEHNGLDVCRPPLYLIDGEPPQRICRTRRVGVDYAGAWAKRLLRFIDPASPSISRACRPRIWAA